MTDSIIEVKPTPDLKWGVYFEGTLIGYSKHSFDCDYAAECMSKLFKDVTADHHATERQQLAAVIEESNKKKKKDKREVA